ncbi:hypothetical protein [Neorhodopirellula lusitana]|uniref:hypothetical protein n=1 Tax=Neorhodopirellula lusitana TaxID=445327 RepID=UPI00384AE723
MWRYSYAGSVTEDVNIAIAKEKIKQLNQLAEIFGFDFRFPPECRWPKMSQHTTNIDNDTLPEDRDSQYPIESRTSSIREPK